MNDFCIVGSGPSAISAAVALTRKNLHVTMLDAGRTLDPSRAETVTRLSACSPAEWNQADVQRLKEGVAASRDGIPIKRLYGSDFAFRTEGAELDFRYANAGLRPGFAQGGLSNVWGAGMLPFHRDDMADWPFDAAELDDGYRGVLSFVPCSGVKDALEDLFPNHSANLQTMTLGRQGQAFLRDAARSKVRLARHGIVAGQSRLAVKGNSCERCGMCLYGCPYELIYNSAFTLRELRTLPNFRYESGFVVERLHEENGSVRIDGHDLTTRKPGQFETGRVLLGAGVIPSTAILISSLGDFDVKIRIQDSFYFLVPLLRFEGMSGLDNERLHTLAQAFVVMRDPAVCRESIYLSVYGYNDLMIPALRASLGALGGIGALASRVLVAGSYLHSRLSPGLWMTVQPGHVLLEGEASANAVATAKKAAMKLLRQSALLRAVPLIPAMRFPLPGRGFHAGGTFPMQRNPHRHTSDIEGRPYGFKRVHLIDASCLPSIPATPITLPVMANAWRIANRAAERA